MFSLSLWGSDSDKKAYFAEAFRVLKPNGKLIIIDSTVEQYVPWLKDLKFATFYAAIKPEFDGYEGYVGVKIVED